MLCVRSVFGAPFGASACWTCATVNVLRVSLRLAVREPVEQAVSGVGGNSGLSDAEKISGYINVFMSAETRAITADHPYACPSIENKKHDTSL